MDKSLYPLLQPTIVKNAMEAYNLVNSVEIGEFKILRLSRASYQRLYNFINRSKCGTLRSVAYADEIYKLWIVKSDFKKPSMNRIEQCKQRVEDFGQGEIERGSHLTKKEKRALELEGAIITKEYHFAGRYSPKEYYDLLQATFQFGKFIKYS